MIFVKVRKHSKGFSFIEMQMIIAILAMALSLVYSLNSMVKEKRKQGVVNETLSSVHRSFTQSNGTEPKGRLIELSKNRCSNCSFRGTNFKELDQEKLSRINQTWMLIGYKDGAPVDPWGNPLLFDENRGEFSPNDCRNDIVESAGPNGIFYDKDDIWICTGAGKCPVEVVQTETSKVALSRVEDVKAVASSGDCLFDGYIGRGVPPF